MTLLLYGIADGRVGQIEGSGLERRPLRGVAEQSLVAVVSEHDRARSRASEDELWEYERVVEGLMDRFALLPARFGSSFEGEAQLRAMVRDRHDQLVARFDVIRGAVELSVTATWPERAGPTGGERQASGTAYMLARVEQHRRAAAIASRLESLSAAARASKHRLQVKPSLPVVAAYLVDRGRVEQFAALVKDLDEQLDEAELVCTGPWPPYSFTTGGDS
jgi:Gas vesicle synthesis protein GvpL/GvpF